MKFYNLGHKLLKQTLVATAKYICLENNLIIGPTARCRD